MKLCKIIIGVIIVFIFINQLSGMQGEPLVETPWIIDTIDSSIHQVASIISPTNQVVGLVVFWIIVVLIVFRDDISNFLDKFKRR
jgi:hypothetical protein